MHGKIINMKKWLPVILVALGVLTALFFVFKKTSGDVKATLTPSDDMHWLKLDVSGISSSADSMEYELIYSLPDGRIQGVPGTIKLEGKRKIERDILLGTESSGNYYYDEGVETGSLTLRFFSGNNQIEEYEKDWVLEDLKSNPKVF